MNTVAFAASLATFLTLGSHAPATATANPAQSFVSKFASVWNGIKTYQCTITAHEVRGTAVQDRVYHYYFSKPFDTRAEVVGGDGRGSVGIWRGGDKVQGHQGGLFHAIKMNVDLHSHLAMTLRGATFAQSNMGYILEHLQSLPLQSMRLRKDGTDDILTVLFADPKTNDGVSKEVYYFGADGLPQGSEQFEGDTLVKSVKYSDLKINVNIPKTMFNV